MALSQLAELVLDQINRSSRGNAHTGKYLAFEQLEERFSDYTEDEILSALDELKVAQLIREPEESEGFYFLTPVADKQLSAARPKANAEPKIGYTPNDLEFKILQFLKDNTNRGRPKKETPVGLAQDITRKYSEYDRSQVETAIEILAYQKLLQKKTESFRHDPKAWNPTSKERARTIKTEYVSLTGKALLLLDNRSEGNNTAVFDQSTPYSTRRKLETIFENGTKQIAIADNYVGRKTLDYLQVAKVPVRILTSSWLEKNFEAALEDFEQQYSSTIKIQRLDGVLHGRFIIVDDKYYLIDHSIKDFGAKPSTLIEILDPIVQDAYKKLISDNWPKE